MRRGKQGGRWKHLWMFVMTLLAFAGICFADITEIYAADPSRVQELSVIQNARKVDSAFRLNGRYLFSPQLYADTKMTKSAGWDNRYVQKMPEKLLHEWWPLADADGWTNTCSKTLTESDKGKLWVQYDNVGSYLGRQVSMRMTFTDWAFEKNLPGEDYAHLVVTLGETNRETYPTYPVIDIKCLEWVETKFEFFDPDGNRLDLYGHFTFSDLDYAQGFGFLSDYESILYSDEAAAHCFYDPVDKRIWAREDGTQPSDPKGWITYVFRGSEQIFRFYDAMSYLNPTNENFGVRSPDWAELDAERKREPASAASGKDWYWYGVGSTDTGRDTDYLAWGTDEFGYTALVPFGGYTVEGGVTVKKKDSTTGEVIPDAEFTVYEWDGSAWKDLGKLNYSESGQFYYRDDLEKTEQNGGRFRVMESKTPNGYVTGSWAQEFRLTKEGFTTVSFEAKNDEAMGRIVVVKEDAGEAGRKLAGAVYQITAKGNITSPQGKVLFPDGTVMDTVTTGSGGTVVSKDLPLGTYRVTETTPPAGYVRAKDPQEAVLSYEGAETPVVSRTVTFRDTPNRVMIRKLSLDWDGGDAGPLAGVSFRVWNKTKETEEQAAVYTTAKEGTVELSRLAPGEYGCREVSAPEGYLTDDQVLTFTVDAGGMVNGQAALTLTVRDQPIRVAIAKTDALDQTGVPGAHLAVFRADGELVERFVSGGEPHRMRPLPPGRYRLVEEEPPEGFFAAEPAEFEVRAVPEVQTVTMEDLPYGDLTVEKRIRADEITWAHGEPAFLFRVSGKDIRGTEHTFWTSVVFTPEAVSGGTGEDGYVTLSSVLKKVPLGADYQVTEQRVNRYGLTEVSGTEHVTVQKLAEPASGKAPEELFRVSADLTAQRTGTRVTFTNRKYDWSGYSHSDLEENVIPIRLS